MTDDRIALRELLEKGSDATFLREMIGFAAQRLMELEVGGVTGAAHGERSPERLVQRNGYRDRDWHSRVGTVELRIPRLRRGSYFPAFLEPRRTGLQDQRVEMETTPCGLGGRRWWWICPATGRRCATLYLPNGSMLFLSRGCGAYRLAYASQNGGAMDRSHGRLARLHRKMGGEYHCANNPPPRRPKWMLRRTYARLVVEWETAMERHDEIFTAGAARLSAQLPIKQG
jgi:hypothetical protein